MSIAIEADAVFLTQVRSRDPETLEAIVRYYLSQVVRAARARSATASATASSRPSKQRMAVVLREIEGLATDEICKILEVSDTHFGVLLYRVRNRLRECLEAKRMRR